MSSSSNKACFNSGCKDVLERPRKGWRRRTGEFADLCDRCASAYEEGKFCETFHLNSSGWRCCESCGKQIHCGCIVSFHTFVLLDAGGIECINCARKSFILTPNPAWPPPSVFLPAVPERIKDLTNSNWSKISTSGPVPWRKTSSLFCSVDIPSGINRHISSELLSTSSLEQKKIEELSERSVNESLKLGALSVIENGNAGTNEEQSYARVNVHQQLSFSKNDNVPQQSSFSRKDQSNPYFNLAVHSTSPNNSSDQTKVSGIHAQQSVTPSPVGKLVYGYNDVNSSCKTRIQNGKSRGDIEGRNQLLPQHRPGIIDRELHKISEHSNSIITLFEKILSASDAGRVGRLVLPKKCAEAYFPPISQPEGVPLNVQDSKGKEWIFQFRFWPNNNSRMYVLEGVTPCIQSMQLQAGDIVTFSRLEPGGKLVMGFRKASTAPSPNQVTLADSASTWSKVDKSRYNAREVVGTNSSFRVKRKNNTLGSKGKRFRIDKGDLIELEITLEQAQRLLRPPSNHVPTVMVIEGFELEEYKDAPIIGRPTIFATDLVGGKIQWAQCEECFKWRKVPDDAILPSRWTCSDNSWDLERSLCSASQEVTAKELEELLPRSKRDASRKVRASKQDQKSLEALEGLDTLANLAIQEEVEALPSSSQATTKHPRHRPGCTCIVCIQPPSGKGPKHKQTCACNVCLAVKRRFQTQMLRHEKKQAEKEAECEQEKPQQRQLQSPEQSSDDDIDSCSMMEINSTCHKMVTDEDPDDEPGQRKFPLLPFKGQIDLNIQPEREEDLSLGSDSAGMRLLQDSSDGCLRQ